MIVPRDSGNPDFLHNWHKFCFKKGAYTTHAALNRLAEIDTSAKLVCSSRLFLRKHNGIIHKDTVDIMYTQKTIKKTVSCSGVGLHSGNHVHLTFKPAAVDSGIVADSW